MNSPPGIIKWLPASFLARGQFLRKTSQLARPYERRREILEGSSTEDTCAFYPPYRRPTNYKSISAIISTLNKLSAEQLSMAEERLSVGGRVMAIREAGSRLLFADISQDGHRLQLILNRTNFSSDAIFQECIQSLQRGDLATGTMTRTTSGQLSLAVCALKIVTPCIQNIPDVHAPHLTEEHRARMRHLDLIARPDALHVFKMRSKIIRHLRAFLEQRGFIEVETPILASKSGGATARPFKTHLDTHNLALNLRIAPELHLKQLIVGGLDRVYELGRVFRNEGIDHCHNPEFTICELYQSFSSMEDMMLLARELLVELSLFLHGTTLLNHEGARPIDFGAPFREIDVVKELEHHLQVTINLEEEEGRLLELFKLLVQREQIKCHLDTENPWYFFDKLVGHCIEPQCIQPTFLINQPIFQSPLARAQPNDRRKSARFELFIGGKEIMNAYSELNDPVEQRRRFEQQQRWRLLGDEEAHIKDEDYIRVLEAGMPPTAGCGIGIDRLVMLLMGKRHIRDVLLFPLMRPLQ